MGDNDYDRDVGKASSSGSFISGGTSSATAKAAMSATYMDPSVSPKGREIRSDRKCPIVVMLDGTGSNIGLAHIVYDKAPMFHGQIAKQGYLDDYEVSWGIIGDASIQWGTRTCDQAPLQVSDFAFGIKQDDWIERLYLEGGGGGQLTESYELAAHYLANHCHMPNAELPFLFIIGDEAPYPTLDTKVVKAVLGEDVPRSIDTSAVMQAVFDKFQGNVYVLQNAYCSRRPEHGMSLETQNIRNEWLRVLGPNAEHLIQLHEEKSFMDIMLGVIAMVSGKRNLDAYKLDLKTKGQSATRIDNVTKSLDDVGRSIVPRTETNLPAKKGKGTTRRL